MADSVQMINEMVAVIDQLPKTAGGDARVEDPTALAVQFVGIVAPLYQADYDDSEAARQSAESLASQQNSELLGLRAEVDQLRAVLAQAKGHLAEGHVEEAMAALATV